MYLVPGGVPDRGGLTRGVYLVLGGVSVAGCTWSGTPPPPVDRMIHASENITLLQTSFAGGNKDVLAVPLKMNQINTVCTLET